VKPDYPDANGVTNADIDEALRQMRAENGGHEPYAPAVYGVALSLVNQRMKRERESVK